MTSNKYESGDFNQKTNFLQRYCEFPKIDKKPKELDQRKEKQYSFQDLGPTYLQQDLLFLTLKNKRTLIFLNLCSIQFIIQRPKSCFE